jgi:hypothetical protein
MERMEILFQTFIATAIFSALLPLYGKGFLQQLNPQEIVVFIFNNANLNIRRRPEAKKVFIPIVNNNEFHNDLKENIRCGNN